MRHLPVMILGAALAATGGRAALGAEEIPPLDPGDCVVSPAPEAVPDTAGPAGDDATLSELLDPCDGVLAPAPVGDGDLTVAPPPVGRTPVITPDEVPPQPAEGE